MKRLLFFALFCFSLTTVFAFDIWGRIVDSETSNPLEFVNIALYKQGSETPMKGMATNDKGSFKIESLANGKYTIQVTFVGYNTYNRNFTIAEKDVAFGTIKLTEDSKMLTEVQVVGQGSQMRFEADRKVFSVDQNIASAGGSATEVLENIPSVQVDNEGNVSLRNNESVEVWINGKPSGLTAENRAQILQQMPAESIESIEVITNPSAKYNPEGTAGIINLVLKKNRNRGYYGSISAGVMYPDKGKLGGTMGANVNISTSKLDAFANIGYRNMNFHGGGLEEQYNYNPMDTIFTKKNRGNDFGFSGIFGRAGIDYHIDEKNTISLSGFGMTGGGDGNSILNYDEYQKNEQGVLTESFERKNINESTRPSFNANLDYKHEFDKKGTELLVNFSYSEHTRTNENIYFQNKTMPNTTTSEIGQKMMGNNKEVQIKVDYTNKLSETARLEVGWQSNLQKRVSTSEGINRLTNDTLDGYFNDFDYNEQIHAAYATYGNRFDKFSVQGGLRGEYLMRDATNKLADGYDALNMDPSYFKLYPSLYLGYAISKNQEVQLNYTRRVSRARGRQINPFRDYSDSTSITFGNPGLTPEFSSAFELNYIRNWDNHTFSTSAYYRFTENVIQSISYRANQTLETTYMNIPKSQNAGLELVLKNRFFKILNLTSTANLYYSQMDAATYVKGDVTESIKAREQLSWNVRMIGNIMLSPTFSGQITGNYSSPRIIAQGTQSSDYSIDLGLRKSFLDRNLNVSLNVRDLLNSRKRKSTTYGDGFMRYSESYFHGRMIGVTVSYNFGNMRPKRSEGKSESNGDNGSGMDIDME